MQRGKFITIEGQDGAGKSSNLDAICNFLKQKNIPFVQSREPGGTPFGEQVRELLLASGDDKITDKAELLLVFAARSQHLNDVIEPALDAGKWVVCDRFTDASYAYQGGGRGLPNAEIAQLEQMIQGNLRPDLTLVLDLPVAVSEQRAGLRSAPDRFEQQQHDFKQRVRDAYLRLADETPHRVKVVDASQPLEQVQSDVQSHLANFCGVA